MRVPTILPSAQQSDAPLPEERIQAPPGAFAGNVLGQDFADAGKTAGQASQDLSEYATLTYNIANKQAADAHGYDTAQKMATLYSNWRENNQGKQATVTLPDLQKQMLDLHAQGKEGLSPLASSMYDELSRRYMFSFNSEAASYSSAQWRDGTNKEADAAANNAGDIFLKNPTPENYATLVAAAGQSTAIKLAPLGKLADDDPRVHQQVTSYLSPAISGRVEQLYDSGDVAGARSFMEEHKDSLTPEAYTKLDGALRVKSQANDIHALGHAMVAGGNVPLTADHLFNNGVIQQESSGRPGIVNTTTGAQGIGQVMPKTTGPEMALKLGIPWKPELMTEKTPEAEAYQRQISHAYFDEGWQKYGGDPVKTLEYYYGGPDEKQWGKNTKQYVGDVLTRVGGGHTLSPLPQNSTWTAQEYVGQSEQTLQQRLSLLYPGNDNAEKRYQIQQAAMEEVRSNAQIMQAHQGDNFDKISAAILSNPSVTLSSIQGAFPTEWSQLPGGYQKRLEGMIGQQNSLDTPTRQANFYNLLGASAADADKFADPTQTDIRAQDLSSSERNYLMKLQANLGRSQQAKANRVAQLKTYLNDPIVASYVKQRWPTADAKNTADYQQFIGALDARIQQAHSEDGAPPKPEEIRKAAQDLIASKAVPFTISNPSSWFGIKTPPAYQVPKAAADEIQTRFSPTFKRQLSPEEVANIYQYNQAGKTPQ